MRLKFLLPAVALIAAGVALSQSRKPQFAYPPAIEVPFDLVVRHIIVPVRVNGSRPLSFVFDTGDRYGLLDLDRANELHIPLGGHVSVRGVGAETPAAFVKDASFSLTRFPQYSQGLKIALPLRDLGTRLGHDFDGIFGSDFISEFVVEVDYAAKVLRLHDRDKFEYHGNGESIPIRINSSGHPILKASVTPVGGSPIDVEVTLDLGSSAAVELNAPFVKEHQLPGRGVVTMRAVGSAGAGGTTVEDLAPLGAITIGRFTIVRPVTYLSRDTNGSNADRDVSGRIGERIASKFRIFLDYSHDRIILEPLAGVSMDGRRPVFGAAIIAEGSHFDVFRVTDVAEHSAAEEDGLRKGDVIPAIDGRPASSWTLSALLDALEQTEPHHLIVLRGKTELSMDVAARQF